MEYIEYDIKQIINEILKGTIIPNSVELNCELFGTDLNNVYDSYIYYKDEVDGIIEVYADFSCTIIDGYDERATRGSFKGKFILDYKSFIENSCEVSI